MFCPCCEVRRRRNSRFSAARRDQRPPLPPQPPAAAHRSCPRRRRVDQHLRVGMVAIQIRIRHPSRARDHHHLARAQARTRRARRQRGSSASQNDDLAAVNLDACALGKRQKAAQIGVVGREHPLAHNQRVGAADRLHFLAQRVAKGQYLALIGNGDVKPLERAPGQKLAHLLRRHGVKRIRVAADHLVDARRIAVAEPFADEAVLHLNATPHSFQGR